MKYAGEVMPGYGGTAPVLACGAAPMTAAPARLSLARRALRVALCYLLALQAFAASFGIAGAFNGRAAGFGSIICHSSAGDAPAQTGKAPGLPCALCAVAASAVALADPAVVRLRPVVVAVHLPTRATRPSARAPPVRTGLARAPPQFA